MELTAMERQFFVKAVIARAKDIKNKLNDLTEAELRLSVVNYFNFTTFEDSELEAIEAAITDAFSESQDALENVSEAE